MRAALICDAYSLFSSVIHKFSNKTLNYLDFCEWISKELGVEITYKAVYICNQTPKAAIAFITLMKANGFDVYCDVKDWNCNIALKVADIHQSVDAFIFATDNFKHLSITEWLMHKGKIVTIANFNPQKNFNKHCTKVVTITPDVLKERPAKNAPNRTEERLDLPTSERSDATREELGASV